VRGPIALTLLVIASAFARPAFADGVEPFSCGGGPHTTFHTVCEDAGCPELIDWPGGCVVPHAEGVTCGFHDEGRCTDIDTLSRSCPISQTDGAPLPTRTDAGAKVLYCVTARHCEEIWSEEDGGGCTVGAEQEHRGRLIGLPSALLLGGVFLLAVDRRRRKRRL